MQLRVPLSKVFLISLFYLAPIVDCLTGVLILGGIIPEGGAGSPSQLFRFFLTLLVLKFSTLSKKYFYFTLSLLAYIIAIEAVSSIFHQSVYGLTIGMVYGSKVIFLVLIFTSLKIFINQGIIDVFEVIEYFKKCVVLTSVLLIVPFFLGIGYNTYAEGTFGFKGFFPSGNGLGIFMGSGLLFLIYAHRITVDRYSYHKILLALFGTAIIGSKTALLFVFVGVMMLLIFVLNKKASLVIVSFAFVVFLYYLPMIIELFDLVFDVIVFRYNKSDSLFSFIMSARDDYFISALNDYRIDGLYILRVAFGFGAYTSFRNPSNAYSTIDVLESDFADLFFMYGALTLLCYIFALFYFCYLSIKKKELILGLIFMFISLHSLIAGHMAFNGMSGVLLPVLAFIILERDTFIKKIGIAV